MEVNIDPVLYLIHHSDCDISAYTEKIITTISHDIIEVLKKTRICETSGSENKSNVHDVDLDTFSTDQSLLLDMLTKFQMLTKMLNHRPSDKFMTSTAINKLYDVCMENKEDLLGNNLFMPLSHTIQEVFIALFSQLRKPKQKDLLIYFLSHLSCVYEYCDLPESSRSNLNEASNIICILEHIIHKQVLADHQDSMKLLFTIMIKLLTKCDDGLSSYVSKVLEIHFLTNVDEDEASSRLNQIQQLIFDMFRQYGQKCFSNTASGQLSERPYLILCGLANCFLPISGDKRRIHLLCESEDFWQILQAGMFHQNALTRKRTVYLLKRLLDIIEKDQTSVPITIEQNKGELLFFWNSNFTPDFVKTWQELFLLYETLEEKQLHVVKPVMPRLSTLIEASYKKDNVPVLLHTSWLVAIFQRIACHDNTQVKHWGVTEILQLDLTKCPLFEQQQHQFLCGPLIKMMTESSIFYKPQNILLGTCPPISRLIRIFFRQCCTILGAKEKELFFNHLVLGLRDTFWSGASLVYVMEGLAQVEPIPVWNIKTLNNVKQLLTETVVTMETHYRAAIQYYLLSATMKLTDLVFTIHTNVTQYFDMGKLSELLVCLKHGETIYRGINLWLELTQWVKKTAVMTDNDGSWSVHGFTKYITEQIANFVKSPSADNEAIADDVASLRIEAVRICRIIVLAYDAGVFTIKDFSDKQNSILFPVTETLEAMGSHAYMTTQKADRNLLLWLSLLQEAKMFDCRVKDPLEHLLWDTTKHCSTEILIYVQRRVPEINKICDMDRLELYMEVISNLITAECDINLLAEHVDNCMKDLQLQSLQVTEAVQLQKYCSITIIGTTLNNTIGESFERRIKMIDFVKQWKIETKLEKPSHRSDESCTDWTWGKLSSLYVANQWRCVSNVLSDVGIQAPDAYVEDCLTSLDVVSGANMLPVFEALRMTISKVPAGKLELLFDTLWRNLLEESKNAPVFWPSFKIIVQIIFHPELMQQTSCPWSLIKKYADKIMDLGSERMGFVNVLASWLCHLWQFVDPQLLSAIEMIDFIVKLILFGPVHSRGNRFMHEVHSFLRTEGDTLPANVLHTMGVKDDSVVRVQMLSFLAALDTKNQDHVHFVEYLISHMMKKQWELVQTKTYSNFPNSLLHRKKHRLFSGLLVLLKFIIQSENLCVKIVFPFLLDMVREETQSSVRFQVDWLITRCVHSYPSLLPVIWTQIKKSTEKKSASLCSLLVILGNLSKLITDKEELEEFISKAIPCVLPWCMEHNFSMRVFSQATLLTLWDRAVDSKLTTLLQKNSSIKAFVDFTLNNSTAAVKARKLRENFAFNFHPIRDYSIETITHILPKLSCLTDEEWITVTCFIDVDSTWSTADSHNLPAHNTSSDLSQCPIGSWKLRTTGALDEDEISAVAAGDVQKKIIPWLSMLPEQSSHKKEQDGLILVTSLINKIPNLGGLCRTAEIFGVSEYVIRNLRYIEDKQFESLSVTAHKWLVMKEVMPRHLSAYLREKRNSGYTLVGAEQTANSKCLTDYTFPKKTLLLLGNEKEGIPVELIQLLDVCVEIPQQGVIRSLNVHVSGALLIWEYTRQQLLNNP